MKFDKTINGFSFHSEYTKDKAVYWGDGIDGKGTVDRLSSTKKLATNESNNVDDKACRDAKNMFIAELMDLMEKQ